MSERQVVSGRYSRSTLVSASFQRQPLIELNQVLKVYDTPAGGFTALKNIDLTVYQGEFVAIIGKSGSGKSTLLKAISGIHPPRSGSVKLNGTEISRLPSDRIVEMGLAYIPEARNLFNEMTVLENLRLGAYNRRARRKVDQNLELVFKLRASGLRGYTLFAEKTPADVIMAVLI